MKKNYADFTVGVTEARNNFKKLTTEARGKTIALLQANKPIAYIVPTEVYETMVDELAEKQTKLKSDS